MKKINILILFIFLALSSFSQTTATNFNGNDCSGNNHDLFEELNNGKVIVIDWVMPCSSCLGPSKTAYNIVQSYASSNPGKVLMYVCDDYANTSCTSLGSWLDNNGMPNTIRFSTNLIKMSDYGADGMPKIIVIGGINHSVYFNEINTEAGNVSKLQAGIKAAMAAASINEKPFLFTSSFNISPNPANGNTTLSITLSTPDKLSIEIFNSLGEKIKTVIKNENLSQGINDFDISTHNIPNGIYFIKVYELSGTKIIKLAVSNG
ncbi:MAG: T9SS type A sorting domain-containing protein [Bacteroidia bacterium]